MIKRLAFLSLAAAACSSSGSGPSGVSPGTHFGSATPFDLPALGYDFYTLSALNDAVGDGVWTTIDIDGDGKLDLVVTAAYANEQAGQIVLGGSAAPYWDVYRGTGTGFAAMPTKWNLPALGYNFYALIGENDAAGDGAWTAIDIDGDGKLDLVVTAAYADAAQGQVVLGGIAAPYWDVYRGTGTGFAATPEQWALPVAGNDLYTLTGVDDVDGGAAWSTVDLDGDGKLDFVVTATSDGDNFTVLTGSAGTPVWDVYRGTGTGFGSAAAIWPLPAIGYNFFATAGANDAVGDGIWSLLDLDGAGKPQLVVTAASDGENYTVLGGSGAPHWDVYANTGAGFGSAAARALPALGYNFYATSGLNSEAGDGAWSTFDLDGDGYLDLLITAAYANDQDGQVVLGGTSAPHWDVYRGAGASFGSAAVAWALPAIGYDFYTTSAFNDGSGDGAWSVADITGDGRPDLIVTAAWQSEMAGQVVLGGSAAPYWDVYPNTP